MAAFEPIIARNEAGPPSQIRRKIFSAHRTGLSNSPSSGITILICVVIGLYAMYRLQRPEPNPYLTAASVHWKIPLSSPSIQRKAHKNLQAFCTATLQGLTDPPKSIELEWTQKGKLQDMAINIYAVADPHQVVYSIGTQFGTTNKVPQSLSPDNPYLVKVENIQPLDAYADPYIIYAFQNTKGFAMDIVSNQLIYSKNWEQMAVFTHITQLDAFAREMDLPRSEVYFVDIGANLGAFTLGIAAAGFQVIAIEAMSVNQFALSMSLCANMGMAESVTLLPVALGKEAAQCTVFSARHNVLDGTIRCGESGEEELLKAGMLKRQVVDVVRLDDLLKDWLPALQNRVGSLKMDTEGFEPAVIQGGKKFFSTVRPRFLQLEVSSMSDAATGISSTQMLEALAGLGYEIREEAFGRPLRPKDMKQKPGDNPGNVYLYAKSNAKAASDEAIDRLDFEKYAEEYKELQAERLKWLADELERKKKKPVL